MELQKKYDQSIYNICELILKKKFKRAIRITQHLQFQGFTNNQLAVLRSYAIFKHYGPNEAIESIKFQEGPLFSAAKGQYSQALAQWHEADIFWKQLLVQGSNSAMNSIELSNRIIIEGTSNVEVKGCQQLRLVGDQREQQAIKKINTIYNDYQQIKLKLEMNQLTFQQFRVQCSNLVVRYEEVIHYCRPKKEIKVAVEQFIEYLSNL